MNFGDQAFDKKIILLSAAILFLTLCCAVVAILLLQLNNIGQVMVLSIPFVLHIIFSIFVKNRVSWLLGATSATMISLIIFVGVIIVLIK